MNRMLAAFRPLLLAMVFCSGGLFTGCTTDNADSPVSDEFDAKKYALVDLHLHLDGSLSVDDVIYTTSKYRELFAYAKAQGVPFVIHAGEADGVESMRLAVEYGAKRISHGVRAFDDAEMKLRRSLWFRHYSRIPL